jgi:hypothetical protein
MIFCLTLHHKIKIIIHVTLLSSRSQVSVSGTVRKMELCLGCRPTTEMLPLDEDHSYEMQWGLRQEVDSQKSNRYANAGCKREDARLATASSFASLDESRCGGCKLF